MFPLIILKEISSKDGKSSRRSGNPRFPETMWKSIKRRKSIWSTWIPIKPICPTAAQTRYCKIWFPRKRIIWENKAVLGPRASSKMKIKIKVDMIVIYKEHWDKAEIGFSRSQNSNMGLWPSQYWLRGRRTSSNNRWKAPFLTVIMLINQYRKIKWTLMK